MHFQIAHNMALDLKNVMEDCCDEISSTEQLSDESIESLEDLLPKIHQKQSSFIVIEERIKSYLRQLQITFKTDPRKKEFEYYEKQQKTAPQFLGSVEGSPCLKQIKQKSKYCMNISENNMILSKKYM